MDSLALGIIGSIMGITSVVVTIVVLTKNTSKDTLATEEKHAEAERSAALLQRELEIKYTRIEKDLAEIKALITSTNDRYTSLEKCQNDKYAVLEKRIFIIEQRYEDICKKLDSIITMERRKKS